MPINERRANRQTASAVIRQLVFSTAVGTFGLSGCFHGQVHSRVRVPQLHTRHWAGQWQVMAADFIGGSRIGLLQLGIVGVCRVCHNPTPGTGTAVFYRA